MKSMPLHQSPRLLPVGRTLQPILLTILFISREQDGGRLEGRLLEYLEVYCFVLDFVEGFGLAVQLLLEVQHEVGD
jgi:hypothetical protein